MAGVSPLRALRRLLQPASVTTRARGARTTTLALIVAVGAACFVATSVISSAVQQTIEQGTAVDYHGVDIVVRADSGIAATASSDETDPAISDSQIEAVRQLPGVVGLGAVVRASAAIRLANNEPRQLTLESLPDDDAPRWQQLASGELPDEQGEVALSGPTLDRLGLAVGDIVTLVKPGAASASFRVVGVVDVGDSLRYGLMNYGIVTTPVARAFADVSGYNEIRIETRSPSDVDRLIAALPTAMPSGFPQRSADIIEGLRTGYAISLSTTTTALSVLSLIIAALALLAFAALSWTLFPTHRHALVLLRTVGASRGQLVASTLFSSAGVAGVGGLIGTAAGSAITPLLLWLLGFVPGFPTIGAEAIQVDPTLLALVPIGSTIGGLVAGACVVAPLFRLSASGRTPVPARGMRVLASLIRAALIVIAILASATFSRSGQWTAALLSTVGLVIAVVIASPQLYALAARAAGACVGRRWPVRELAALQVRATSGRAAAAGLAVTAATGIIALGFTVLTSYASSVERSQELSPDPQVVLGTYAGGHEISPEILSWLGQASGVTTSATISVADDVELREADESGPAGIAGNIATVRFEDIAAAAPDAVRLESLSPDVVYLPESDDPPFADGSTVVLTGPSPDATVELAVRYVDGLPFQALIVGERLDEVGAHAVPVAMWLRTSPDADRAATIDNIRGMATLAGITTVSGSVVNAQENADALNIVEVLLAAGFIIAVAVAAWAASLCVAATIEQRRRDLAILRTIGMDASATRSLIRFEAWTIGVLSCVLGVAVGATVGWAGWGVLAGVIGLPLAWGFPTIPVLVAATIILLIVIRAIAWPIDSVLFVSPARALRDY